MSPALVAVLALLGVAAGLGTVFLGLRLLLRWERPTGPEFTMTVASHGLFRVGDRIRFALHGEDRYARIMRVDGDTLYCRTLEKVLP